MLGAKPKLALLLFCAAKRKPKWNWSLLEHCTLAPVSEPSFRLVQQKMNPNATDGPVPMTGGVPVNDGGFIYRYRYMDGGLTSAWLGAGR